MVTVPNLDPAGNVGWMLTIYPESPDFDQPWELRSARVQPISGMRPDLMGVWSTPPRPEELYITDDVRLWLILTGAGVAAFSLNTIRENVTQSINQSVGRTNPRSVTVAVTRQDLADRIAASLKKEFPRPPVAQLNRQQIIQLFPPARDAQGVLDPVKRTSPRRKAADVPTQPEAAPLDGSSQISQSRPPRGARAADAQGQKDTPAVPPATAVQPAPPEPPLPTQSPARDDRGEDMTRVIRQLAALQETNPDDWENVKASLNESLVSAVERFRAAPRASP